MIVNPSGAAYQEGSVDGSIDSATGKKRVNPQFKCTVGAGCTILGDGVQISPSANNPSGFAISAPSGAGKVRAADGIVIDGSTTRQFGDIDVNIVRNYEGKATGATTARYFAGSPIFTTL